MSRQNEFSKISSQAIEAGKIYDEQITHALSLEQEAAVLREKAPTDRDSAIYELGGQVLDLVEETGVNDVRLLMAGMAIGNLPPSRQIGHSIHDEASTIRRYESIESGTLALLPEYGRKKEVPVIAGEDKYVVFSEEKFGSGRIYNLAITVGFTALTANGTIDSFSHPMSLNTFSKIAIGSEEIQERFDGVRIEENKSLCGCGKPHFKNKFAETRHLRDVAEILNKGTVVEFDTSNLDETIEEIRRIEEQRSQIRYAQRRVASRRRTIIRG
jgi:hypothetical protein